MQTGNWLCAALVAALVVAAPLSAAPTPLGGGMAPGNTPPPGEPDARARVDRRIDAFAGTGRAVTLGLLKDLVAESIAFGAPAYNKGDVDACARFYMKTGEKVLAAFGGAGKSTPGAAIAIDALRTAAARCTTESSTDRRAWTMRFAFDKIQLYWQLTALRAKGLIELATQSFAGERFAEAADAYRECADALDEVAAEDLAPFDTVMRSTRVMLAHALLAQGDYPGAARAIEAGLAALPELPLHPIDLKKIFRPKALDAMTAEVAAAAAKPGAGADVHFLLGYLQHCAGKRDLAVEEFKRATALEAAHTGARAFLK